MNRLIKSLLIIITISTTINANKMWKITTSYGDNLSCTQLVKISNDSLHATILNKNRMFAINDIVRISTFNRNINKMMLFGAIIGGGCGLVTDTYLTGNQKIDIQNNGVLGTLIGLAMGTFTGHLLSANNSIDMSEMTLEHKRLTIASMILTRGH